MPDICPLKKKYLCRKTKDIFKQIMSSILCFIIYLTFFKENIIAIHLTQTKEQPPGYQAVILCFGRDYWTRTSDLAPPRRVRYQLR